ncbi:endonuclease [Actinoallomurus iriomotensis]|uniref:Endonuclease n=1 Tax=Actinoallomurus iriomotensis TaxID=478107 RepID=A0A9W6SA04_9ACTN|nr:endonuclease [Actinoallomurus iriomotensis]GLY89774.1 endonuclease [Actinoallomurus iriomotensis]
MDKTTKTLLSEAGHTYAEDAGITLKDQPAALFKLLVLTNLLSTRINAEIAVAAARELFEAGGGTPRGLAKLGWQGRVDALGRAHYVRYDESTSTRLGDMADKVMEDYAGDLRRLPQNVGRDADRAREALQEFPGIGPVGAEIFCREAQAVWPWLRPSFDALALKGAERLGLSTDPKRLAELVADRELARLASALVRVAKDKKLADRLVGA